MPFEQVITVRWMKLSHLIATAILHSFRHSLSRLAMQCLVARSRQSDAVHAIATSSATH
jgi:hypothetical protein